MDPQHILNPEVMIKEDATYGALGDIHRADGESTPHAGRSRKHTEFYFREHDEKLGEDADKGAEEAENEKSRPTSTPQRALIDQGGRAMKTYSTRKNMELATVAIAVIAAYSGIAPKNQRRRS